MLSIPAGNPSPWTGPEGNNTYLLTGAVPTLIDAGVGEPAHIDAVAAALGSAALAQILVTHSHTDHARGVPALIRRWPGVSVRNLAPDGTVLVYGALSGHRQTDPAKFLMPLFAPRLIYSTSTVRGWWLPRWVSSQPLSELRAATSDLLTMLANGALAPPESVRYSIEKFQEAVQLADGEAGQQKVLLDFS